MCRYLALTHKEHIDFFETEYQPAPMKGTFWATKEGLPKSHAV